MNFSLEEDGKIVSIIRFDEVIFFESSELVPKGIVLSFYYSHLESLNDYPLSQLNLEKLNSFDVNKKDKVAFFDGSYGFELTIIHKGEISVNSKIQP